MKKYNFIDKLRLPVIVAPMFLVSNPDLVIASSNAGLIGSFPGPNARTTEELEGWMEQINSSTSNSWAFNMITHKTYDRFGDELDLIKNSFNSMSSALQKNFTRLEVDKDALSSNLTESTNAEKGLKIQADLQREEIIKLKNIFFLIGIK